MRVMIEDIRRRRQDGAEDKGDQEGEFAEFRQAVGLTTPMRLSRTMTSGSSNTAPAPSRNLSVKSIYWPIVTIAFRCSVL